MVTTEAEVQVSEQKGIIVLSFQGYFNEETGLKVNAIIDKYALDGKIRFVMNFSNCPLINSPGVATLLDITMKIFDDFKGKMVLTGLDQLKWTVMKMVHIIPLAGTASSVEEACQLARK